MFGELVKRTCAKCGKEKCGTEFYRRPGTTAQHARGFSPYCKECTREVHTAWMKTHPAEVAVREGIDKTAYSGVKKRERCIRNERTQAVREDQQATIVIANAKAVLNAAAVVPPAPPAQPPQSALPIAITIMVGTQTYRFSVSEGEAHVQTT